MSEFVCKAVLAANNWYKINNQKEPLCFIKMCLDDSFQFKTTSGYTKHFKSSDIDSSSIVPIEDKDIPSIGRKYDGEKLRWGLLPEDEIEDIVKVLTFGAKKYAPENWKFVPGRRWRYFDAVMRHLMAYKRGKKMDEETGLHTLSHALCCLLFLLWTDKNPKDDDMDGYTK